MFIRVVNAMLGLWLFASTFIWVREPAQFYNGWIVGLLVMGFGIASIVGRGDARRVNFLLGIWLFLSALLFPNSGPGSLVNQLLVAALVVTTSLFPSHPHWQGTRTAA